MLNKKTVRISIPTVFFLYIRLFYYYIVKATVPKNYVPTRVLPYITFY